MKHFASRSVRAQLGDVNDRNEWNNEGYVFWMISRNKQQLNNLNGQLGKNIRLSFVTRYPLTPDPG